MILHNDGSYTIYTIKCRKLNRDSNYYYANLCTFGFPEGFKSSDECWQKTGIHGTFNLDEAKNAIKFLYDKHPDYLFKFVKLTLNQKTDDYILS